MNTTKGEAYKMSELMKLTKQELIDKITEMEAKEDLNIKEVEKAKKDLQTFRKLNEDLTLQLAQKSIDPEKDSLKQRVDQLRNESFEKQRLIKETTDDLKKKDEQIKFLESQLNGLSDLFNEIYLGLKDQNSLLGVYSRNIIMFQEKIDAKIAQFNGSPNDSKKEK